MLTAARDAITAWNSNLEFYEFAGTRFAPFRPGTKTVEQHIEGQRKGASRDDAYNHLVHELKGISQIHLTVSSCKTARGRS